MYSTNRSLLGGNGLTIAVIAIGAVVILGVIILSISVSTKVSHYKGCTVEDKDRTSKSEGGSDMRVYTSCGNFVVDDSILEGTFSSSDLYREIKVGETYDFKTRGSRIPIFSMFPNIVEADKVVK